MPLAEADGNSLPNFAPVAETDDACRRRQVAELLREWKLQTVRRVQHSGAYSVRVEPSNDPTDVKNESVDVGIENFVLQKTDRDYPGEEEIVVNRVEITVPAEAQRELQTARIPITSLRDFCLRLNSDAMSTWTLRGSNIFKAVWHRKMLHDLQNIGRDLNALMVNLNQLEIDLNASFYALFAGITLNVTEDMRKRMDTYNAQYDELKKRFEDIQKS